MMEQSHPPHLLQLLCQSIHLCLQAQGASTVLRLLLLPLALPLLCASQLAVQCSHLCRKEDM